MPANEGDVSHAAQQPFSNHLATTKGAPFSLWLVFW